MVDRRLDDSVEGLQQLFLIDIMLVLADADGFGFDFDKFRQGILNPPGDRHSAPQRDIEVRKFLFGEFGSGVDGGAGFVGDHIMQGQGMVADQAGQKFFRFIRGGAVADRGQGHIVATDELQHQFGGGLALGGAVRQIKDGGGQDAALGVDDGRLAAGPIAWIQPQHGVPGQRRNQQELPQIAPE